MQINPLEDTVFRPHEGMIIVLLTGKATTIRKPAAPEPKKALSFHPSIPEDKTYTGPCLLPSKDVLQLSIGSKLFVVHEPLDAESTELLHSAIERPTSAELRSRRRSSSTRHSSDQRRRSSVMNYMYSGPPLSPGSPKSRLPPLSPKSLLGRVDSPKSPGVVSFAPFGPMVNSRRRPSRGWS